MVIKGRNTYKYTALQKPNPGLFSQKGFVRKREIYFASFKPENIKLAVWTVEREN